MNENQRRKLSRSKGYIRKSLSKKIDLLLPKTPSYLTPEQISSFILRDMKQIEGPVSFALLIPNEKLKTDLGREGPVIVLLGDLHIGNEGCGFCFTHEGCYSLYKNKNNPSTFMKWIDRFSKKYRVSTDLFLEFWLQEDERTMHPDSGAQWGNSPSEYNSALTSLIYESSPCVSKKRLNCPFPHIRTHLSDPRFNIQKYNADNMELFIQVTIDKSGEEWKEYLRSNYPGITRPFTPEYIIQVYKNVMSRSYTVDQFFDEPFFKDYSRAYHEWKQLPELVRNEIRTSIRFYEDYWQEEETRLLLSIHSDLFFTNILDQPTDIIRFDQNEVNLFFNNHFTVFIIELYTVSRILKNFKGGLPSQLAIVYEGEAHTSHLKEMLQSYYTISRFMDVSTPPTYTSPSKCIKIDP